MSHHKVKLLQSRGIDLQHMEKPYKWIFNFVPVLYFSQGKVAESIKYLGEFMKTAENAHLSQSLVDACVLLGNIYNERVSTGCSNDVKQLGLMHGKDLVLHMRWPRRIWSRRCILQELPKEKILCDWIKCALSFWERWKFHTVFNTQGFVLEWVSKNSKFRSWQTFSVVKSLHPNHHGGHICP